MTPPRPEIQVNDVVQIEPDNELFGACFMVVTELKPSWNGLMGYVTVPGKGDAGGSAYLRIDATKVVYIGKAEWSVAP